MKPDVIFVIFCAYTWLKSLNAYHLTVLQKDTSDKKINIHADTRIKL